jgi:hypothetical protein
MNITLYQSSSISETETGVTGKENIFPSNGQISSKNRLFISCGANSNKSMIAGQVVCDAIKTYFHSFLEKNEDINIDFIEKAIRFGEIYLDDFKKENIGNGDLTATLCFLFFATDCVYFCQIGKSHVYQIRNNRIIYKSIDSSLDKKIYGSRKPVEINIVKLKDIQALDHFFIYCGELANFQEELIGEILSQNITTEDKLSKIKDIYLNKTKSYFSAHLIPIRETNDSVSLKQKLNSFLYFY